MKYSTLLASLLIPFSSAIAATQGPALSGLSYQGVDQNNQPCSIEFAQVSWSKTRMMSSCDFERDGVGPWCSTAKNIEVRAVSGQGSFASSAGTMGFALDDKFVEVASSPLGISATGEQGGTVSLTLTGDDQIEAYFAFLSEYGQSISPEQRTAELLKRTPGVSYEQVFNKIYTNITCKARR